MSTPVNVHHVVSGPPDAPVLVLSNSLGSTKAMWDAQLDALAERFRVVRYDTRGHGGSPVPPGPYSISDLAEDVVALLDRLHVQRAHFAGLSLGGMTGMRLAARYPERVDRLILLCTAARFEPSSAWTERAATVRAGGTSAIADAVVRRWFTPAYRDANPAVRAECERMVSATPAEGYASCCDAIAGMDLRADLPAITAPALAIAGADDPATPPAQLEAIASSLPNGRVLVVPDAAHLANIQQPGIVTEAIIKHLTTSEAS